MQLKDIDCSRLTFDIYSDTFVEDLKEKIPEFNEYEGKIDELIVFRFVVLMWDMRSPLLRDIEDYHTRLYTAALLSGFPHAGKNLTEESEKIVIGENDSVNKIIVAYTSYFALPEYQMLMAYQALVSGEHLKILRGEGTANSDKILEKAGDKIERYSKIIFSITSDNNDEYFLRKQALYQKIEKDKLRLKPEQIIKDYISDGKLPKEFNQYGDYSIDIHKDIKFVGDHAPKED